MNVKIDSIVFKSLLEKVLPQVPKKSALPILQCVLMEAKDNQLTLSATDLETTLSVFTKDCTIITEGKVLVHYDEVKIISKLTGELEISLYSDTEIMIKSGKKVINIGNKDITDYPELPNTLNYLPIIEMKESDFTKDITKLHYFINEDSNNKMMKVYNLNMKQNRFEALDGYRVAVIDLVANKLNDKYNLLILGCINTILKKVLSEKSKDILRIGEYDNKYIVIKGNNYIYVQRMVDGLYYNIDNILRGEYDLSMTVNTKELMDIMKFDLELIENYDKKPVIIYYNQKINKSYVYLSTIKHNTCDELSFTDINIGKEFMIGFNPQFIYDACKCIEDKEIKIMMHNSKSPCIMEVTNEKYLILPVNINALGLEEGVKEYINKIA